MGGTSSLDMTTRQALDTSLLFHLSSMLLLKSLVLREYVLQECESEGANKMIGYLRDIISKSKTGDVYGKF